MKSKTIGKEGKRINDSKIGNESIELVYTASWNKNYGFPKWLPRL